MQLIHWHRYQLCRRRQWSQSIIGQSFMGQLLVITEDGVTDLEGSFCQRMDHGRPLNKFGLVKRISNGGVASDHMTNFMSKCLIFFFIALRLRIMKMQDKFITKELTRTMGVPMTGKVCLNVHWRYNRIADETITKDVSMVSRNYSFVPLVPSFSSLSSWHEC